MGFAVGRARLFEGWTPGAMLEVIASVSPAPAGRTTPEYSSASEPLIWVLWTSIALLRQTGDAAEPAPVQA